MSVFTVDPDRLAEITYLAKSAHDATDDGSGEMGLLEAVAYVAGLPHSDHPAYSIHPACTSPILAAYGRRLNDVLPDDLRQELVPLVPRLVGTAWDGLDEQRGYLAVDWLIRTYIPAWLELAGLASEAAALRELGRVVDTTSAQRTWSVVRSSREKAARAIARAARDARAARAATATAIARAARAATWDARYAGDAAWDATWEARTIIGDAAGDAAWNARAIAGDAAWNAAWDAAWDAKYAEDAAGDAARAALAPTVTRLQRSAIALFDRMITAA